MSDPAETCTRIAAEFGRTRLGYEREFSVAENWDGIWSKWTPQDWVNYAKFRKAYHGKTAKYDKPSERLWHFLSDPDAQLHACRTWAGKAAGRERSYRRDTGREVADEVPAAAGAVLEFCDELRKRIEGQ